MTVINDITRELVLTESVVEATIGTEGMRRYADEAGTRICAIPAVQAAEIDSAELVGFIYSTIEAARNLEYGAVAHAIADRFALNKQWRS